MAEGDGLAQGLLLLLGASLTFPTAASPSRTSLTLLDGFGVGAVVSAIEAAVGIDGREYNTS